MKYLLDTHVFIWSLNGDPHLTSRTREIIRNTQNQVFISISSLWEIIIKASLNKLKFYTDLETILANLEFELLPIKVEHLLALLKLPFLHKDPFDRMLVAQAKVENCTLITDDQKIKRYDVPTLDTGA
jgi:PIN domain nuclease of toxin-antitoxin system